MSWQMMFDEGTPRTGSGIWSVERVQDNHVPGKVLSTHSSMEAANGEARGYLQELYEDGHIEDDDKEDQMIKDVQGQAFQAYTTTGSHSRSLMLTVDEMHPRSMKAAQLKEALQIKGVPTPKGTKNELMEQLIHLIKEGEKGDGKENADEGEKGDGKENADKGEKGDGKEKADQKDGKNTQTSMGEPAPGVSGKRKKLADKAPTNVKKCK